jgi:hypothetical protein
MGADGPGLAIMSVFPAAQDAAEPGPAPEPCMVCGSTTRRTRLLRNFDCQWRVCLFAEQCRAEAGLPPI